MSRYVKAFRSPHRWHGKLWGISTLIDLIKRSYRIPEDVLWPSYMSILELSLGAGNQSKLVGTIGLSPPIDHGRSDPKLFVLATG
jgi:hypothetical protein